MMKPKLLMLRKLLQMMQLLLGLQLLLLLQLLLVEHDAQLYVCQGLDIVVVRHQSPGEQLPWINNLTQSCGWMENLNKHIYSIRDLKG